MHDTTEESVAGDSSGGEGGGEGKGVKERVCGEEVGVR